MEERRDPGVQEPQEEKDYAFMQEVIKDETGSRKFKRDVRRLSLIHISSISDMRDCIWCCTALQNP